MKQEMRRLAEIHIEQARELALRLLSYSSTIIPEEYIPQLSEITTKDLANFALHARRISDLCDLKGEKFSSGDLRYNVDPSTLKSPIEADYHSALNRLIHASSYVVDYTRWDGPKVYLKSASNVAISFVRISTDFREDANVSIFGTALCFLTQVIVAIKSNHPDLRF